MSRQKFTDNEKELLLEKKYIILDSNKDREFATRIATHLNVEFQITKNDRGFYLKTLPIIESLDEDNDEEYINISFNNFNELLEYV